MLDLPLSARLAAWGNAALTGRAPLAALVSAVERDDEPHTLLWEDEAPDVAGSTQTPATPAELLRALPRTARLVVALPAPGDPVGLPGPPAVNAAALEAGECVLVELDGGERRWALVPEVVEFGSTWEPGAQVVWRALAALPRRAPDPVALTEAERSLRTALAGATTALAALDVARWREDAADRIAALRAGALRPDALPQGVEPRAARVAASAAQVLAIAELASEDDGAAITSTEAVSRARLLRDVGGTARRALVVAVNAGS
ncbi:hypothetical protein CLV92_12131 [Kineococcus xinjiangensis]|uniref:Uncharacterized protein n=1 Tax=Kineococcus xinjiangensis TaxID=512762 RepID=A0A2S6ICC3_9ACTN|nr:hypothetical protein [Kineococcus xinjiangensis]PPK90901.1 hypothetical protein CLV92_12131 [Kineococcus xinjiangensis]